MGANVCKDEKDDDDGGMAAVTAAAAQRNRQIDAELRRNQLEQKRTIKILLLGSANSGKSTIAKQMRILHSQGFSESELINYRYMIHTNFIVSYHHIVRGIYQLNISIPDGEQSLVDMYRDSYTMFLDYDDEDQIKSIIKIRSFSCVAEATRRMNEFQVPDNTSYLFSEAKRILQLHYKPTPTDVVHARASTTGVHEITFAFKKFNIRLIDVGGQRTERRKWIHCFENVTAILFIYALSCYDEFLEEDPSKNRMEDSIELFLKIFNNEYLRQASFILFANKRDLFEQKLAHVELNKFFPEYQGSEKLSQALEFVQNLFLKCQPQNDRPIYDHVTNATDTKNIDFVFGAACDIILQNNLTRSGMA